MRLSYICELQPLIISYGSGGEAPGPQLTNPFPRQVAARWWFLQQGRQRKGGIRGGKAAGWREANTESTIRSASLQLQVSSVLPAGVLHVPFSVKWLLGRSMSPLMGRYSLLRKALLSVEQPLQTGLGQTGSHRPSGFCLLLLFSPLRPGSWDATTPSLCASFGLCCFKKHLLHLLKAEIGNQGEEVRIAGGALSLGEKRMTVPLLSSKRKKWLLALPR